MCFLPATPIDQFPCFLGESIYAMLGLGGMDTHHLIATMAAIAATAVAVAAIRLIILAERAILLASEAAAAAAVAAKLAARAISFASFATESISSSRASARSAAAADIFFSSNSSHSIAHSLRGEFQTRWRSLARTSASPRDTNVAVNSSSTVGDSAIYESPCSRANRRCAALSRSVQRAKRTGLSAGLAAFCICLGIDFCKIRSQKLVSSLSSSGS